MPRTASRTLPIPPLPTMSIPFRHQLQQLELHLRGAPPEAGQLDALQRTGQVGAGLHNRHDSPLEVTEDLPETHVPGVHRTPAGILVGAEQIIAHPDSADRLLVVAETPRTHADPPEILHRVADMGKLPVENGAHAFGAEDDVADPIVSVHDDAFVAVRQALTQPAEGELEGGMRIGGNGAEDLLVA